MAMDDRDRSVVIAAITTLAVVAFLALLALLFDPLLVYDENDGDDQDDYNSLPRFTVDYPDAEAYFEQLREYQQKLEIYEKEKHAYEQQQDRQLQQLGQIEEADRVPKQNGATQSQSTAIAKHKVERVLQEDVETSSVESATASARKEGDKEQQGPTTTVIRKLEESFDAVESLCPFDESEALDDGSAFRSPSLTLSKQSISSSAGSGISRKEVVDIPIVGGKLKQRKDVEDTIDPQHEFDTSNNSSSGVSNSDRQEPPPTNTAVPEEKTTVSVKAEAADDTTTVSPLKNKQQMPPPEKAPPPVQHKHQPGGAPPVTRSQQAAATTAAQVNSLKTMIPRYSHKAERQRFIIMNTLILIIIGSITTVLVLRFYI